MTALERRWARVALASFAPERPEPAGEHAGPLLVPEPGEVDYLEAFDAMRRGGTRLSAFGLRLSVWIVTFAPPFLGRGLRTLASLSPEERAEVLGALLSSRRFLFRELALLLKIVAAMALLGAASVRQRSGYDRGIPTLEALETRGASP